MYSEKTQKSRRKGVAFLLRRLRSIIILIAPLVYVSRSMSRGGFTHTATGRLAQLAQNSFEEEQCELLSEWQRQRAILTLHADDLGVDTLRQLATLGWHPTR